VPIRMQFQVVARAKCNNRIVLLPHSPGSLVPSHRYPLESLFPPRPCRRTSGGSKRRESWEIQRTHSRPSPSLSSSPSVVPLSAASRASVMAEVEGAERRVGAGSANPCPESCTAGYLAVPPLAFPRPWRVSPPDTPHPRLRLPGLLGWRRFSSSGASLLPSEATSKGPLFCSSARVGKLRISVGDEGDPCAWLRGH